MVVDLPYEKKEKAKPSAFMKSKAYKENPEVFKGNVADVSMVLRVALTTKSMTPDLYEIMKNLGKERILKRYQQF